VIDSSWFKALNHWCYQKTPIGSGLTIPFLVGVEKRLGRGENFKTSILLDEFTNLNDYVITIRYCDYIGMDVCELDEINEYEQSSYKNYGSLFLAVSDYDEINNLSDLKKVIAEEYSDHIKNYKFSLNDGVWSDFTEGDLKWLTELR